MKQHHKFVTFLSYVLEYWARARTLAALVRMDPRQLRDIGISPELLAKGVAAWPWREEPLDQPDGSLSESEIRTAEAELKLYSDAELIDLGISREEIPDMVRYGRPGIDKAA